MVKDYKTILFTSNLSETSRLAFKHAALLASRFNAKIVLLHVMEGTSASYDSLVISLFGEDKWLQVLNTNREIAKHALVGKVSHQQMAKTALNQFCKEGNENEDSHNDISYEIVVKEGEVVDTILTIAKEFNCDLIIMGAGEGLISGATVGKNIKNVLKKSKVPVFVIPAFIC